MNKKHSSEHENLSELQDRVWCCTVMFDQLIADHPMADEFAKEINRINNRLNKLYQKVGASASKCA